MAGGGGVEKQTIWQAMFALGATEAEAWLAITGKLLRRAGRGTGDCQRPAEPSPRTDRCDTSFRRTRWCRTLAQAQAIATGLLSSAKHARRDVEMEWRGNPALELGDPIAVVTDAERDRRSEYVIIRQGIDWAGYLRARLTGRRIS